MKFIFDLDGTITNTQLLHKRAWIDTLVDNLDTSVHPYIDEALYLRAIDGKPRRKGLFDALTELKVPVDGAKFERMLEIKGNMYLSYLKDTPIEQLLFPDFLSLANGKFFSENYSLIGTSSESGNELVQILKIGHLFRTVYDGRISKISGVRGKPHSDFFDYIISKEGCTDDRFTIVEDSISGIVSALTSTATSVLWIQRASIPGSLSEFSTSVEELLRVNLAARRLLIISSLGELLT